MNGKGETRLSFVAYGGNQFFQSTKRNVLGQREVDLSSRVNGKVISAHVKGIGRVNLSQSLQGSFKKILNSFNDRCVFWDFKINGMCDVFFLFKKIILQPPMELR